MARRLRPQANAVPADSPAAVADEVRAKIAET